jgi:hypothetical protein
MHESVVDLDVIIILTISRGGYYLKNMTKTLARSALATTTPLAGLTIRFVALKHTSVKISCYQTYKMTAGSKSDDDGYS